MVADSAPAEVHNLRRQKHMGTWGRTREGARGCELWGFLTCAMDEEHQQSRSPGHGADVQSSASRIVRPQLLGSLRGANQHPPPPS